MVHINNKEHSNLLEMISNLEYIDGLIYRKSLEELYDIYLKQLGALGETVKHYKEIAAMIRQEKPIVELKKYIRVKNTGYKEAL